MTTTVGTRLKVARINAGYRQFQVVEILAREGYEISQNTLSNYENDRREVGLKLLKLLSEIYRVSPEVIIWSEEELLDISKIRGK